MGAGRRYGELVEVVENLKTRVTSPTVRAQVMGAIVSLAEGGAVLKTKQARKMFAEIFPEIVPFLDSDKDFRIAMDALQKAYDDEVLDQMKSFEGPLDWFLRSQSKLVDEIRSILTDLPIEDLRFFLKVVGERALSANSFPRSSYFHAIKPIFDKILQSKAHAPRLLRLLNNNSEALTRLWDTGFITDFDFWRIKGEIMEILTASIKQEFLAKHPNAVLIEGVMAKTILTREGDIVAVDGWRQIWDGIIAEVTNSGLKILVKFEVKSGQQGFQYGYEQILSTHFLRLSSFGDQLRVVLADGTERIFRRAKTKGAKNAIVDESETVLITPLGNSSMMPNQKVQIAIPDRVVKSDFELTTRLLELGQQEITHTDVEALVMDLLISLKPVS